MYIITVSTGTQVSSGAMPSAGALVATGLAVCPLHLSSPNGDLTWVLLLVLSISRLNSNWLVNQLFLLRPQNSALGYVAVLSIGSGDGLGPSKSPWTAVGPEINWLIHDKGPYLLVFSRMGNKAKNSSLRFHNLLLCSVITTFLKLWNVNYIFIRQNVLYRYKFLLLS